MDLDIQALLADPKQLRAKLSELHSTIHSLGTANTSLRGNLEAVTFELDDARGRLQQTETVLRDTKTTLDATTAELEKLQLAIKQLLRRQFGPKSERLDPDQFQLALEGLEQDVATAKAESEGCQAKPGGSPRRRTPARRNRGHLPAHLERYEVTIDIEDKSCPCCGGELHEIGVEASEQRDIVPSRLRVRVTRARAMAAAAARRRWSAPRPIAPSPAASPPGWSPASRWPIRRQHRCHRRAGMMGRAAWWLRPVWELLVSSVLTAPRVFVDDTHLPVQAKGKCRTGYLWGLARDDRPWAGELPPAVAYVYTEDRRHHRAQDVLAGYQGIVQADGWGGFKRLTGQDRLDQRSGPVTLAFCWSHGRRGFVELHKATGSPIAAEVLTRIAALYAVEDRIRGVPPDQRRAVRQEHSRPMVDKLKAYLDQQFARVSGKAPIAKAIRYLLTHWQGLCVFLDDGRVELDNNTIERLHRVVATTRKNALLPDQCGARSWAIFTSHIRPPAQRHHPFAPEGRARAHRFRPDQDPSARSAAPLGLERRAARVGKLIRRCDRWPVVVAARRTASPRATPIGPPRSLPSASHTHRHNARWASGDRYVARQLRLEVVELVGLCTRT
jgi:transposase